MKNLACSLELSEEDWDINAINQYKVISWRSTLPKCLQAFENICDKTREAFSYSLSFLEMISFSKPSKWVICTHTHTKPFYGGWQSNSNLRFSTRSIHIYYTAEAICQIGSVYLAFIDGKKWICRIIYVQYDDTNVCAMPQWAIEKPISTWTILLASIIFLLSGWTNGW